MCGLFSCIPIFWGFLLKRCKKCVCVCVCVCLSVCVCMCVIELKSHFYPILIVKNGYIVNPAG